MRMVSKKFFLFFCAAAFFAVPLLFAEYNSFGIPDSSEIRKKIGREWFEGPLSALRSFGTEVYENSVGIEFELRFEEQDDAFLAIVAPASYGMVDIHDSRGSRLVSEKIFSADSAGSWILVRDKKSGTPILIRYYFAKDSEVYVQFRPNKKKSCFADMIIFDSYAARAVPLGIPFEKFYTASFAEIQELTKRTLPWNYVVAAKSLSQSESQNFKTYDGIYDDVLVMIQSIRENLGDIVYLDDAMYDERGEPVSLETGRSRIISEENKDRLTLCSQGFVKWIVDGIVEPLAGSYLRREPLLAETVKLQPTGYQGIKAASYNINSALDWTRNLAAAALSVVAKKNILYKDSGVDVTVEPFAARITEKGVLNTAGYIKNAGYRITYLKQLLYVLAATNPDYFYLAAIRQTDASGKIDTRVFNECAAIFPYFDVTGSFRAVVFYDGIEYTLDEFCDACLASGAGDVFVHLVRVRTTAKYYLQAPRGKNYD